MSRNLLIASRFFFLFVSLLTTYHLPLTTCLYAATSRSARGITIDGDISDWSLDELVYEDPSNDSPYGVQNELQQLYVTWDNSNFYMAVSGVDQSKALVVYLATGPGGITDASQIMNTSGGVDNPNYNWWWGAKHTFPSNFTPQFQWNSFGMRVDPNDGSHGFFHYEGSPIRGVRFDVSQVPQALVQTNQPNFGAMEIAIPWTTLFPGVATPGGQPVGLPAGAQIKILASLKDGEGKSARETIPNQSGTFSSDGNSFFAVDSFLTISVALATGTPIFNISPIPRNFQATAGPQQVSLSWNKRGAFENHLKHFALERSLDNFATFTTFAITELSFLDDNLQNSTTYSYRLRAVYDLPGQGVVASSGASVSLSRTPAGPKVTHSALSEFAYPSQPLRLVANIPVPAGENLTSLKLFWRPKGASAFNDFVSTKSKSSDNFVFEISSANTNPPGIDYYLDARSNSGITLVPSAAPASFFTIAILESAMKTVSVTEDTRIALSGGQGTVIGETSIFIPAFSLPAPTPILIQAKSSADLIADKENLSAPTAEISNIEAAAVYDLFALDSAGNKISASFSKKATLTLFYTQSTVDDAGIDASRLRVYRWSGTSWVRLGGSVDAQKQTVTVQVDHLSRYALFETNTAFLNPADTQLKQVIRSVFFPHLGEVLELVVENAPSGTKLEIFTAKGAPVRSMTDSLIWNGKNDSGEIVESGLYIYQLQLGAKKITGSCVVVR